MSRVLVVDSHAHGRDYVCGLLRHAGHDVSVADNDADALEQARRERPELVIADVLLPGMDGAEFATALHDDPDTSGTRLMFRTAGYRLAEARRLAAGCGVETVVGEPIDPQSLLDAVDRALGETGAPPGADGVRPPEPLADYPQELAGQELAGLQQSLQAGYERGLLQADPDGVQRRSSDRLMQACSSVRSLSMRLAAALQVGVDLAHQRDPDALLAAICTAGQDILDARIAMVCVDVGNGERPCRQAARGLPSAAADHLRQHLDPAGGVLGAVARERSPRRLDGPASGAALGLPEPLAALDSVLVVPVAGGPRGTRGWLLLGNRLGGPFGEEDQRLATMLATQLAAEYANLMLLDELGRHAAQLETEIVERKFAVARLSESERRFRQLAEAINDVFFLIAPAKKRLLYLSPAYHRIWGRSPSRLYARLESWLEDIHPDDRARVEREVLLAEPQGQFDSEFRIVRPDGAVRWIRCCGFPVRGTRGELQRVAGIAEDVTERHEHEQRITRLTRIYAVLSGINSAIVRIRDRDELMREACRIAVEAGCFRSAWIGVPEAAGEIRISAAHGDRAVLPGADSSAADQPGGDTVQAARRALSQHRPSICNGATLPAVGPVETVETVETVEHCGSMAAFPIEVDGHPAAVLVLCAAEPGLFDQQEVRLLRELAGDIGFGLQYIAKEEGLKYLAYYDPLTDLANGTLFLDRLAQFLDKARPAGEAVGVMVLDLERFTRINDNFGRQVGDSLLRLVADRLRQSVDDPFSLARISADTFALAVGGLQNRTDIARLLKYQVLRVLELPFTVDGIEIQLSARVGISASPGDGDDAATLFKNAEAALKQAQASGERFLYYAPQMNAEVSQKLALEAQLRQAFEQDQFSLHYQPKLGSDNRRIVGFEALVRWRHPQRGLVLPGEFIPILEETGLILELGEWALRQALEDHRRWTDAGFDPPRIAVNVSALQLHRADFAERVLAAVATAGVEPDALELEITESLIMRDFETGIGSLRRLRDAGVCISVDDFGTGYSSLRYLAQLPLDTLKIDRSFVVTMLEDPSSMAIVSMVISLAHALKLLVVAEGVDDRLQASALQRMGCHEMQGFLFSRPVAAERAGRMLRRGGQLGAVSLST